MVHRSHNRGIVPAAARFTVAADSSARAWMATHHAAMSDPVVVSYEVKRCCGGGKICMVRVGRGSGREVESGYLTTSLDDGTVLLIDPRAARRLPASFGLTVRGIGPLRRLDLDLDSEEWGSLLYD
jgi:hypothetical protein